MRKTLLVTISVSLITIWSCTKKNNAFKSISSDTELIKDANSYFVFTVASTQQDGKAPDKVPLWGGAMVLKQDSIPYVVVPLLLRKPKYTILGDGTHILEGNLTFLYIYEIKGKGKTAEVVTFLPGKQYSSTSKEFVGASKVEDWKGNPLGSWSYNNGVATPALLTNIRRPATTESTSPTACTVVDWYDCVTVNDGADWTCDYLSTTISCPEPPPPPTGHGGGGGGSGPPAPPMITELHLIRKIVDSLKNPCFSMALRRIRQQIGVATGNYSILLNEFYGGKSKSDITITQSSADLGYGNVAVTTGNTNADHTYANIYTVLSTSQLANASQEYLVATIIHEMIHGFLYTHPPDPTAVDKNGRDHNQMAKDWVNTVSLVLNEYFPDLPYNDAVALSWGGLENTDAYKALPQNDRQSIENTNLYHRMGIQGTKCK
jgi:hypothetical protein